ncbi:MAG: DUF1460 domain-containing protein [Muribaculaceae bacterium]|nr:DUF1460 domain-containing protein [Muribaculaceae bacterium]
MWRFILILAALCGCVTTPQFFDVGAQYLGAKYVRDPLGEGVAPDDDPLIRNDAFDCTTFVETVLAGGDIDKLTKIRYRCGNVSFINRNHFIESDWLKNNADLVQNVSAEYGTTDIRHVIINRAAWLRTVHGIKSDTPPVSIDLEYIPYNKLTSINNDVPLIVLFIVGNCQKCDKIGTDIAVVHMGFLLPGGTVLRHASSGQGCVVDTDFDTYVQMRRKMENNIGIALVKIK